MTSLHRRATWLVCLLGIAVTALVTVRLVHSADRAHQDRLLRSSQRVQATLTVELEGLLAGLITMRDSQVAQAAALAAEDGAPRWRVAPESFQALAEIATAQGGALHHARAVGLVRVVDPGELAIYEQAVLGRLAPGLAVSPPPTSRAYVVQQLAPLSGNEAAHGLDLGRQEDRRAAIERARDSGSPSTALIQLDGEDAPAVLLFVPAFDAPRVPPTAEERRSRFVGGLAAMLEPSALLEGAGRWGSRPLDLALVDLGSRSAPDQAEPAGSTRVLAGSPPADALALDLDVADRRWQLLAAPADGFPRPERLPAVAVLLTGLLLTGLLAAMLHLLATRHEHAERRVTAATRSLRAREEELEAANERLRASDETKTRFLVTVSHELRTPLTTVRGFANLLEHRHDELTEHERAAFIGQLARSAEGLSDLLHEVLGFAEEQANGFEVQLAPFDVAAAVTRALADQPRTHDVVVVGAAPGPALGDRKAFQRVLGNLLANARSYSDPGSRIGIWIRPDDAGSAEVPRAIEVIVEDDGPGIPREERDLVFERFHRGREASDGTVPGTGIGLTVARQLMEAMGGTVSVADSSGGARLVLRLPAAVPAAAVAQRTAVST